MTAATIPPRLSPWTLSSFWFGSAFHWLLLLLILMPADVLRFVGEARKGTYLGLVVGIGALIALVLPPLVGTYSDRVGRRLSFLRLGVGVNLAGLVVMALAASLLGGMAGFWVYVAGFLLVQFGNNYATAPYSALIPALVPQAQRGRYSGVMGLLQALGQLLGAVAAFGVGAAHLPGLLSYALVAVLLVVSAAVTLRGVPETPQPAQPGPHLQTFVGSLARVAGVVLLLGLLYLLLDRFVPHFSLYAAFGLPLLVLLAVALALTLERRGVITSAPHARHDLGLRYLFTFGPFVWVFLTRALFSLGQYSVQPFLQFYNGDVLHQQNPGTSTSIMLACIIVGSLVSALVGGRLSDRLGRKPIIYVAGSLMTLAALALLIAPSFVAALGLALAFGLGYGAFISVDWALGSDAMPSAASYARDMGIWHVAFVAPQMSSAPQGFLLDWGNAQGGNLGYTIIFGSAALCFLLGVVLISRVRGVR